MCSGLRDEAAVHRQQRTSDPPGFIGHEVDDGLSDVINVAKASQGGDGCDGVDCSVDDLVACLDSRPETYAQIKQLAAEFPDIRICLDHAGLPLQRDKAYLTFWRQEIASLADAPNVVVKISGLDMGDPSWTTDSWRPLVMHCIESFGVDRTMFGSNWPVGRLFSSYPNVIDAYAELIERFSADEQAAMFQHNAERYFRI